MQISSAMIFYFLVLLTGCSSQPVSEPPVFDDSASGVVRGIYTDAIKGNCSGIPDRLTDEFRESIGTSASSAEILCEVLTDSNSVIAVDVLNESTVGDHGKVQISLRHKSGRVEEREEFVSRSGGRWRMDS